jgi:hypothetical protein
MPFQLISLDLAYKLHGMQEVGGSIPPGSTIDKYLKINSLIA